MDTSRLLADIEKSKEAIRVAEMQLNAAIKDIPIAPRAAKTKIGAVVQAASTRLGVARTNLIHLNAKLAELERSESLAKVATARQELDEAGKRFEQVLGDMEIEPQAETTWSCESVHEALMNLKRAKTLLDELESVGNEEE